METIDVRLGSRSYPIEVRAGGLAELGAWAARFPVNRRILVIADENTAALFGDTATCQLQQAGFVTQLAVVPAGEASKSMHQAELLMEQAIRAELDRRCPILALGGGVVGDLAGFVAATYLRGVPFLQVPTTLLSQVDSSVGGKVAVNHSLGKNLIGAFYQPLGVLIDPLTLNSLPAREFASGMAEVIKYGLIFDPAFLQRLAADREAVRQKDPRQLEQIIAACCRMKAAVVERDEQETGERMLLNFGHTAGHAVEAAGGFGQYTHGEAVALGMLVAVRLSELHGLLKTAILPELRELLQSYALPLTATGMNEEELLRWMTTDKKREAGRLRWVLLEKAGQALICDSVSLAQVKESLRSIL